MIDERVRSGPSTQQQAVMKHPLSSPAVVDAGAGTGKTYTIVERVAQLDADSVSGCPASSILLLTFSKKAAAELRGRIIRRLGPGIDPPECATFHAFALSMLKEHAFELELSPDSTVINDIDARVEFWKAFDEFMRGASATDASAFALRYFVVDEVCASLFDVRQILRDRGISIEEFRRRALAAADAFAKTPHRKLYEPRQQRAKAVVCEVDDRSFAKQIDEEKARVEAAARLFRHFDERLRARNVLTYADLLDFAESAIRTRPDISAALRRRFRHCIVDEFQDTDPRQVRLLGAIFGESCERVMVVGDPRQSIYGFRGARATNVADFAALPACAPYVLTENRRSRQEILDLAHAVIGSHFDDQAPLQAVRGESAMPVVHAASRWSRDGEPLPKAAESREVEARWVAAKIVELLESGRTIERQDAPGSFEALSPRHIAILSRRKTKLQPLIEALNAANLPFRQYGGAGFYEAPEVLDALAWFRLVVEPLDDSALARVLSSPGIGLSDSTLAALCKGMKERKERLSDRALVQDLPSDFDVDARERIRRLRAVVDALDEYAGAPLTVAWEATLDRAGLLLSTGTRSGHRRDQARANLEKLSGMVRAFSDRNPGARAPDFIRYIRELSRADADEQEADPPSADAVNVLTIHAAKGLEWPVVFLIDVWPEDPHIKPRVWIDAANGALLVGEGGDGLKPFHTEAIERQDDGTGNVPRKADRERDPEREREERRLFYVAVTRARDELFVSGGRKYPSKDRPQGRPDKFLTEVIEWIGRRGWPSVDEPAESTTPFERGAGDMTAAPLPLADFIREGRTRRSVTVPTLSFSSVTQFERCPRSVNYRLAYHLPGLAAQSADVAVAFQRDREPAADSLLTLGAYGELVHRALERWARDVGRTSRQYVTDAIGDLELKPLKKELEQAAATVDTVVNTLAGWIPLLAEAPFTLDFDGIAVSGFIDLVAADPKGETYVIDYKTGVSDAAAYDLQLALYREAVVNAYGIHVKGCRIARITAKRCDLEAVDLPDGTEMRRRVAAVAAGIRTGDLMAKPGLHCAQCPYRDAPCRDFPR
jgi:ATP-dependent DNA helicase UvrD/PcrA